MGLRKGFRQRKEYAWVKAPSQEELDQLRNLKAVPCSWRAKRMRGLGEWLLGNQGEDFSCSPKGRWETEEGLAEGVNMSQDQICLETTCRV